jgi:hypothetical protein
MVIFSILQILPSYLIKRTENHDTSYTQNLKNPHALMLYVDNNATLQDLMCCNADEFLDKY